MNARYRIAAPALAALAAAAAACGNPPTAAGPTQTVPAAATVTAASTALATPRPGLTPTGYKALDGSPLYAQCIGKDPASATGATLPLPPPTPYPTAVGVGPPPTPAPNPDPQPRPPATDLPAFDVLSVPPADTTGWARASTPCLGGLSFAVPPGWRGALGVGGYQQDAGAQYLSADSLAKVEIHFGYAVSDMLSSFKDSSPGNGSYFIVRPSSAVIGSTPGAVAVSSELVGARARYIVIAYLLNPKPHWYLSVDGFFFQPYDRSAIADFLALVQSTKFVP